MMICPARPAVRAGVGQDAQQHLPLAGLGPGQREAVPWLEQPASPRMASAVAAPII